MRNSEKWLNIYKTVNIPVIFHISLSENVAVFSFVFHPGCLNLLHTLLDYKYLSA